MNKFSNVPLYKIFATIIATKNLNKETATESFD